MEEAGILALIREIGERAETGISYTDDTATHRLKCLPGENSPGLMCLLYADMRQAPPLAPVLFNPAAHGHSHIPPVSITRRYLASRTSNL